jgi:hypothetical protein
MLIVLVSLSLLGQAGLVLLLRRDIRKNEERCEARRQLRQRLESFRAA